MSQFDRAIERLERHPGVFGAMLVGIEDGMVIAGNAGLGRDSDTAAALAASLFRRTRTAAGDAGLGDALFVRLEAEHGHMCAAARNDIVVVTMAKPGINVGKLRLDMMGAMEML